MKILLLTIVVIILSVAGGLGDTLITFKRVQPRGPSDSLRKAIENLRKQMPCGFPEYGLPPLAPYESETEEIVLDEFFAKGFINLEDLIIRELDDFDIDDITFNVLTLKSTFNMNFKKISAFGKYLMDLDIPEILNLSGDGDLDFLVENLRIKGNLKLAARLSGVQIKDFNVVISLGGVKSNITGLAGGGLVNEFLNKIIERVIMDIIREHEKDISQKIYDFVVPQVNEELKQYSLADIIRMITKPGDPKECIPPPKDFKDFVRLLQLPEENGD